MFYIKIFKCLAKVKPSIGYNQKNFNQKLLSHFVFNNITGTKWYGIVLVYKIKKIMAGKSTDTDIKDSEKDSAKLKQDNVILDLPDVKDIPGQENITAPNFKEMADITASSDDEEGAGLFDDTDNDNNERIGSSDEHDKEEEPDENDDEEDDLKITDDSVDEDSDVDEDEKIALERSEDTDTYDNEDLYAAELDDTDFDGEKLNEDIDVSGSDLDVPGADEDDMDEEIGEEDEENNEYSLGDNK